MNRKRQALIVLLLALLLLTGCWDKVELENRGFVVSLGFDKYNMENGADGPDKNKNRYSLTMSIPNVAALAEKGGSDNTRSIKKADSETVAGAMEIADSESSLTMYYGQAKMAVLGKEILEDEVLFREALDAMERNREINRKMIVMTTQDEAGKILEAEIPGEPMVGMYVFNYYKSNSRRTGITFRKDLEKLLLDLRATGDTVIPLIEENDKEIKLSGAAVVKDFKLAGFLDEKETRGYLWLNGGCKGAVINTAFEGGYIPMRIDKSGSKLDFYYEEDASGENGALVCTSSVSIKGSIAEHTFTGEPFTDERLLLLERAFEKTIEDEISASIQRMQEDMRADGFLLSEKLRKKNYSLFLQVVEDWENEYRNMRFIPAVRVEITGAGAIM